MSAGTFCVLSLILAASSPTASSYVFGTATRTTLKNTCLFVPQESPTFLLSRTRRHVPIWKDASRRHCRDGVVSLSSSASDDNHDSDEDATPTPKRARRRVVRRKDAVEGTTGDSAKVSTPPSPPPAVSASPAAIEDVTIKIQDVRDIVGGAPAAASRKSDENDDGKEVASSFAERVVDGDSGNGLDQLLADARRMRADTKSSSRSSSGGVSTSVEEDSDGGGGLALPESVLNAISTIVTVDFFVVCGFLVWFLLGIFSSTVLKDDAIQIAFNSNFQLLVQPALGILMIGSAAGAIFKKKEDE